jgi:hypothetical protein
MKHVAATVGLVALGLAASLTIRSDARADEVSRSTLSRGAQQGDGERPCVAFWPESRYVAGYDHIVHLANHCEAAADCRVHTSVNPQVFEVKIPVGEERQVTTWRGSPAAKFTPHVVCTLEGET